MRHLWKTIMGIAVVFGLPLAARGEPTWEEFQGLLGKPISAPEVKQFVARFDLGQHLKFDEGSFSNHAKSPFSLLYNKNKVSRIVVTLTETPGQTWPVYKGTLLLGLRHQDTPEDAIRRLGQPVHRAGRDYLHYRQETFDLVLSFDQNTHKLAEIDLDAPIRGVNRTKPSVYDKMDDKAIRASIDRLIQNLNATVPAGWHAAIYRNPNIEPSPGEYDVRISSEIPISKQYQIPVNSPPGASPRRVKAPLYFNFYLLPKYRQDEATHVFGNCPFLLYDERPSLTSEIPESLSRQCREALESAEKVLIKQPEPASAH